MTMNLVSHILAILLSLSFISTALAGAHKVSCGTDATTQLQLGQTIMGQPTAKGLDGAVSVAFNASNIVVSAPPGMQFAARLMGAGTAMLIPDQSTMGSTANCNCQVFSNKNPPGGTYVMSLKGLPEPGAYVVVGYANSDSTVKLVKSIPL
jgi:hypothetical protein